MANWPLDLRNSRILISNDDGIHAPGLRVLRDVAEALCDEVWVVAPEAEQSGAGHSLTLRRPLRIHHHDERVFSVDGTPTDCVLLASNEIMAGSPPDLVLSGINRHGNLGEDVTYSGTVAAAMEATILGYPAIALSQVFSNGEDNEVYWTTAASHAGPLIARLVAVGWPDNSLINVNFPAVASDQVSGTEITMQGRRKIGDKIHRGEDPSGRAYYWIGAIKTDDALVPGTDFAAVAAGHISVTPIDLEMTDLPSMDRLRGILD